VVITGEPTPARWTRQTRNIIGVGLAFMFIIAGIIGVRSASEADAAKLEAEMLLVTTRAEQDRLVDQIRHQDGGQEAGR